MGVTVDLPCEAPLSSLSLHFSFLCVFIISHVGKTETEGKRSRETRDTDKQLRMRGAVVEYLEGPVRWSP